MDFVLNMMNIVLQMMNQGAELHGEPEPSSGRGAQDPRQPVGADGDESVWRPRGGDPGAGGGRIGGDHLYSNRWILDLTMMASDLT